MADFKEEVKQALEEESKAAVITDAGRYVHKFRTPFTHANKTATSLTFDWESLTGRDYTAIEDDMLYSGATLITPEFTGRFLLGMAARACTNRDEHGGRLADREFLQALPIRDYKKIIGRARSFLLRQE